MNRTSSPIPFFTRSALLAVLAVGVSGCTKTSDPSSVEFLVTVRASLNGTGLEGHGDAVGSQYSEADRPAISADGRYVAFATKAEDLVSNDHNNLTDIYWKDLVSGEIQLVSVRVDGSNSGDAVSLYPSISGDGRYVSFHSTATNLTSDPVDAVQDVFLRDIQAGTTIIVSRASGPSGVKDTGFPSGRGRISGDGRFIVFESDSELLDGALTGTGPDTDNTTDIWRRQIVDGTGAFPTELVSVSSSPGAVKGDGISTEAWPSRDGRYIVWQSASTNLVPSGSDGGPDVNNQIDCFWRDMTSQRTRRVSLGDPTLPPFTLDANGANTSPSVSGDGSVVAYHSGSFNLVASDPNFDSDNYSYNLNTGVTVIITVHSTGASAGNSCNYPSVSGDGRLVVFQSQSSNLVSGDSNGASDVFVHDLATHETKRVSVATFGKEGNGPSQHGMISENGQYVVFYSASNNLVDDDNNGADDIFVRGVPR